jgi:glycosyltransferase involved in cell wall biosynthesis
MDLQAIEHRIASYQLPLPPRLATKVARRCGLEHMLLRHTLRCLQPEVVHVHFGVDAVHLWPVLQNLERPIIVTLHGYDIQVKTEWWESGAGGAGNLRYHQQLVDIAQDPRIFFIAVSQHIMGRALALGIPKSKIKVLHIGIDAHAFAPSEIPFSERPMKVLFIGRLVEKKGAAFLIHAMQRVQAEHPAARLVLVGDGPLRTELERLSAQLGVNAEFRGVLTPGEIRRELADTRVFCLPSITAENGDAEGFGLVLLEAQACGVPVVTSAVGGVDEGMIEGQTGFGFAERDATALAHILTTTLGDAPLLTRLSRQARAFVEERMNLRRCNETLGELYSERAALGASALTSCAG